jgi:hypothetical protein
MTQHFFALIENLRLRKNMYVYPNEYYALSNFINGYDFAIKETTGHSIIESFRLWLQKKVNHNFSTDAFTYIFNYMTESNNQQAEELLFNLLKEYQISLNTNT